MQAIEVMEEILSTVFKWHMFPVSPKAEAVLLYSKELSLRKVRKFLLHKGYEVGIETIRKYFHEEPFSQYIQSLVLSFIPSWS